MSAAEFTDESGNEKNGKEPTPEIYRDGRFAVLKQVPVEVLPPVEEYESPELEDTESREAGEFMRYAVAAAEFVENNTDGHHAYDHTYPERADPLIGFEYNGIRFAVEVHHYRDAPRYALVSMQRGDQVDFTLKDAEGYLRSPSAIEYIRGFAGYVESDDPLSKLTRDPNADATIKTSDELSYLVRLEVRDAHLAASPNLHIAPSNTQMALYVGKLADKGGISIDGKVTGENVIPAVQKFETSEIENELNILAKSHPNLRQVLLDSIDAITLDGVDFGSSRQTNENNAMVAFNRLIAAGKAEVANGTDAENIRGTALELISKIDLSSRKNLNLFHDNLSRQYAKVPDAVERELLVQTIERATPQFRARMLESLGEQHIALPEDVTVEWLLANEKEIEAMGYLAKEYVYELENGSNDPALAATIVNLLREIADDPDRTLTEAEIATLAMVGINAALLPLAFEEAAKGSNNNTPLFSKLGHLFADGEMEERAEAIARSKAIDEQLSRIADLIDQPSRDLLKELIEKGNSYPLTTGTTAEQFVAELPEIEAVRRAAAEENGASLEPLDIVDIGKLLANRLKPGFETLFDSEHVESVAVGSKGVTFTMKPGTAPTEWTPPQTNNVPVKHKIIQTEGPRPIVLDYQSIKSLSSLDGGEFYKGVSTPASSNEENGSIIVTVKF